jgi:hypothetical protein
MAFRLWATLLIGGLTALLLLPPFAGLVGPKWMVVPAGFLLVAAYWAAGVVGAAAGRRRLARHLDEAVAWERAGMLREARLALDRAAATVDSFLFSPLTHSAADRRLAAQVARFQLARSSPDSDWDAAIGAYLYTHPQDRDAAAKWLASMLDGRTTTPRAHEITAKIGAANPADIPIQRMLAQLYVDQQRCDLAALQTYRRLLEAGSTLPETMIDAIGELFLSRRRADDLALAVYLSLHEQGRARHRRWLPGIAACRRNVHGGAMTQALLQRADRALAEIAPSTQKQLAEDFLGQMGDVAALRPGDEGRVFKWSAAKTALRDRSAALLLRGSTMIAGMARYLRRIRDALTSKRSKSLLKWVVAGGFTLGVGGFLLNTAIHLAATFRTQENPPASVAVPVTDPFTIQVAAYLKEADAQGYVDHLKEQGLDAYWTRASGANKTWYQVRVSHFKTKAEAKAFGDMLKKRQLIGDYYVANYKRPQIERP